MTREEAINFTFTIVASANEEDIGKKEKVVKTPEMRWLIDKIFDDFESSICKNCKWLDEDFEGIYCRLARGEGRCVEIDEDFGCNRFERKENE